MPITNRHAFVNTFLYADSELSPESKVLQSFSENHLKVLTAPSCKAFQVGLSISQLMKSQEEDATNQDFLSTNACHNVFIFMLKSFSYFHFFSRCYLELVIDNSINMSK